MFCSDLFIDRYGLMGIKSAGMEQMSAAEITKFVVSGSKTEFGVHSEVVSALSAPLHRLIEASQGECLEQNYVHFEDVDVDIFSRFVQFAYHGLYADFKLNGASFQDCSSRSVPVDVAKSQVDNSKSTDTPERLSTRQTTDNLCSGSQNVARQLLSKPIFGQTSLIQSGIVPVELSSKQQTAEVFGQSSNSKSTLKFPYTLASCAIMAKDGEDFHANSDSHKHGKRREYASRFIQRHVSRINSGHTVNWLRPDPRLSQFKHSSLGHVRLWVFARRFAVEALMHLSHRNLAWNLAYWVMSPQTFVPVFGELVRFIYGCIPEKNELRLLMAQFAACVVEDVSHLAGWEKLLTEVSAFAADLVYELANRYA